MRIHVAGVLLVLCLGCGEKQSVPAGRLVQPAGAFSFTTPDGWYRTKLAGIDFVVVSTAPDSGATPNIFVDFVRSPARVEDVTATMVATNGDRFRAYEVISTTEFVTSSGLNGRKITANRLDRDGLPLATFHYLIQEGQRVIAITCTCAATVSATYEPVFDRALATLAGEAT